MSSNYFEEDSEFAEYYEDLETTMDTLPPPPPPPPDSNPQHDSNRMSTASEDRHSERGYQTSSYKSGTVQARRNGVLEIPSHTSSVKNNINSPHSGGNENVAEKKSPSSDGKGPFPFLRRGSRKEPSALNRSPSKPSPEKDDFSGRDNHSVGTSNSHHSNSSSQQRASPHNNAARASPAARASTASNPFEVKVATSNVKNEYSSRPSSSNATFNRTQTQPTRGRPDQDEDVLLQGNDYWGLDNSIMQDMQEIQHRKPTQALPSNDHDRYHRDHDDYDHEDDDHLANTTMTYGSEDIRKRQAKADEELEEFQNLERNMGGHGAMKQGFHKDEYDYDYASQDGHDYDNMSMYTTTTYANTVTLQDEREKFKDRELSNSTSFNAPAHRPAANNNATYGRPVDESKLHKSSMSWGAATQPPAQSVDQFPKRNFNSSQASAAFAPQREEQPLPAHRNNQSTASSRGSGHYDNVVESLNEGGKIIRPVSTLKKEVRSTTPSNNNRGKATNPKDNNNNNRASTQVDDLHKSLEQKAKELETEIETYKTENTNLKKLRKQQEQSLAEIVHKKEEMIRHCEEEKQKTAQWCEEQKQLIEKEKRIAAKQVREMRQKAASGPNVPIRKEKAEMEALQATIEKMKVSNETAAKKAKLNENRLYGLIKEHSNHIENLEKQLLALEEQKILLLDFIAESGLRLPKNIRMKLQNISADHPATAPSPLKGSKPTNSSLQSRSTRISGDRGYAEEIDVEIIPAYSNYHHFDKQQAIANAAKIVADEEDDEDGYDSRDSYQASNRNNQRMPGDVFNSLSGSQKQSAQMQRSSTPNNRASTSGTAGTLISNVSESVRNSWARSSRSSGRYSSEEHDDESNQDNFDDYYQDHQAYDNRAHAAEPQRSISNDGIAYNSRGDGTPKHRLSSSFQPQEQTIRSSVDNGNHSNKPMSQIKAAAQEVRSSSSNVYTSSNIPLPSSQPVTTSTSAATTHADAGSSSSTANRVEEIRPDGSRIIRYRNGTVKEVDSKGVVSKVRFTNQDVKTTYADTGVVVYYYAQAETTHTSYKDGTEIYQFPNGQSEKHNTDGSKEVLFPDKTRKLIYPDGVQETTFPDGVILREHPDGRREIIS